MAVFLVQMQIETGATEPDVFLVAPLGANGGGRSGSRQVVLVVGPLAGVRLVRVTGDERVHLGESLVELPQMEDALLATAHRLARRAQRLRHQLLHPLRLEFQPLPLQLVLHRRLQKHVQ